MRFKKFLIIPVVMLVMWYGYFSYVDYLVSGTAVLNKAQPNESSTGQVIGVGTAVSVQIIRPYFFGLVQLPIYAPGVGSIANMHSTFFFWFVATPILLTAAFLIIEWRGFGIGHAYRWGGIGMAFQSVKYRVPSDNSVWWRLAKSLAIGAVIGFAISLFDGTVGAIVGLLVAYLEFRMFQK